MDETVIPARGQTVLVRNEVDGMYTSSRTEDAGDEMAYVMQRAAGGGTLLGGCYQENNWDPLPDPNLAVRIMSRAVKLCPSLTQGKGIEALSIIRHGVGLRPLRLGGVRLEREWVGGVGGKVGTGGAGDVGQKVGDGEVGGNGDDEEVGGVWVVHNYGHGGFGYQSSYGCAERVVRMVEEVVDEMGKQGERRKEGQAKDVGEKDEDEKVVVGKEVDEKVVGNKEGKEKVVGDKKAEGEVLVAPEK